MLKSLYDYYNALSNNPDSGIPPKGSKPAGISCVIELSLEGDVIRLIDFRNEKGKPQTYLVPDHENKTNGVNASFAFDKLQYMFAFDWPNTSEPVAKQQMKRIGEFIRLNEGVLDMGDASAPRIRAFRLFLQKIRISTPIDIDDFLRFGSEKEPGKAQDSLAMFRIKGDRCYFHECDAVRQAWDAYRASKEASSLDDPQCLITGKRAPATRIHSGVKGLRAGTKANASIVNMNLESVESYGKGQGYNAPISAEADFCYTAALGHLISSSRNTVRIGNSQYVVWATRPSIEEDIVVGILGGKLEEEDKKTQMEVASILKEIKSGRSVKDRVDGNMQFHIGCLEPKQGRVSIKMYSKGTFGEILDRMSLHLEDMHIVSRDRDYMPTFMSIAYSTVSDNITKDKFSHIKGDLDALVSAALNGGIYPYGPYVEIISNIKNSSALTPVRVGYIKAYLNRKSRINKNTEGVVSVGLDTSNMDLAYNLGRLFAVLERTQLRAADFNINTTIKDKFFATAMSTPASVFPQLLSLHQNHKKKLEYTKDIDSSVMEIIDRMSTKLPPTLNIEAQGRFIIGYYHQLHHEEQQVAAAKEAKAAKAAKTDDNKNKGDK